MSDDGLNDGSDPFDHEIDENGEVPDYEVPTNEKGPRRDFIDDDEEEDEEEDEDEDEEDMDSGRPKKKSKVGIRSGSHELLFDSYI